MYPLKSLILLQLSLIVLLSAKNLKKQLKPLHFCPFNSGKFHKIEFPSLDELYRYDNFVKAQEMARQDYTRKYGMKLFEIYEVYVQCGIRVNYQIIFQTALTRFFYLVYTFAELDVMFIIERGVWSTTLNPSIEDYYITLSKRNSKQNDPSDQEKQFFIGINNLI